MRIDVGKLTQEETAALLPEIMNALPEDVLIRILADTLTLGQCEAVLELFP